MISIPKEYEYFDWNKNYGAEAIEAFKKATKEYFEKHITNINLPGGGTLTLIIDDRL